MRKMNSYILYGLSPPVPTPKIRSKDIIEYIKFLKEVKNEFNQTKKEIRERSKP